MPQTLAIDKKKTALIVIDMQNGFLQDEGFMVKVGLDISDLKKTVDPVRRVIKSCRSANIPVIYTRYVVRPDYKDAGLLGVKLPAAKEMKALAAGSWDAALDERMEPQPDDFILDKARCSSFYNTNLEVILNGLNVDTLVICGVTTEMCVDTTVADAFARDFNVFLVKDAVAASDFGRHEAALKIAEFMFATLCTTEEIEKTLA
jgi:ureidoacrylate peracid hydrolase